MHAPISSVLFVCLGNLCRSPTAHAVLTGMARQQQCNIRIDSAGTSPYHKGSLPDARTREAGQARGYSFKGQRSRPVLDEDFARFDLVLAMDKHNLRDLQERCPAEYQHKVKLFLEYTEQEELEVPDPYYGGRQGFELVLDLIEQGCEVLLSKAKR
ncbi:low molecular weight protein-tyrosine-phosphatase [Bowmanella denitrificans]|uniref:protein-tyrosine-phosphatase n=1 Tax=Bowmanella denitrificans TaxID=366582 RepID=A0ABN0WTE0_9ALTE|nr:low molecular weight protein-tyrosine-phosphatase [Bowmanella denitrificans]